jgi:formylmethanofuran dehydrogenase subunit D
MSTYTITKKNQVTIDPRAMQALGLEPGGKVSYVLSDDGTVQLVNAKALIHKNKGIAQLPKRFKGKDIDTVIREAKKEYFKKSGSAQ